MRAADSIPVGPLGITALVVAGTASTSVPSGVGDGGLRNTFAVSIGLSAS